MDLKLIVKEKSKGLSYSDIAKKYNVSRQYIQECVSPSNKLRREIYEMYDYKCNSCGALVGESGHIHHIKYKYNILNNIKNLQLLCRVCHLYLNKKKPYPSCRYTIRFLICSQCGILFYPPKSKRERRIKNNKSGLFFCTKHCQGLWLAETHGWGAGFKELIPKGFIV